MTPGGYLTHRVSPLAIILPILFVVFAAALGLVIFVLYRTNKQKRMVVQPSDMPNNPAVNSADQKGGSINSVSAGLASYSQAAALGGQQKKASMDGQRSPTLNEMSSNMESCLIKTGSAPRSKKYNTVKVDGPDSAKEVKPDSGFKSKSFSNFAAKNEPRDPNHIYENDYDN